MSEVMLQKWGCLTARNQAAACSPASAASLLAREKAAEKVPAKGRASLEQHALMAQKARCLMACQQVAGGELTARRSYTPYTALSLRHWACTKCAQLTAALIAGACAAAVPTAACPCPSMPPCASRKQSLCPCHARSAHEPGCLERQCTRVVICSRKGAVPAEHPANTLCFVEPCLQGSCMCM